MTEPLLGDCGDVMASLGTRMRVGRFNVGSPYKTIVPEGRPFRSELREALARRSK